MEAGLLAIGHASLKLSKLAMMESHALHLLQVNDIKTEPEHQNKGEASRLMNELCRRADMSTCLLVLRPEPFDEEPLNAEALEKWYGKFGFHRIQDKPVLLCRDPKRKVWSIDTDEVSEVGGR
jgi:GNAT superfamily N-acetyltransferase